MTTLTDLIAAARASGCTHAPLPIEEVEALIERLEHPLWVTGPGADQHRLAEDNLQDMEQAVAVIRSLQAKLSEAEAEIDDLLEREESLARARDEAERDRDRFREALDWYATPDNWRRWPIELARVKYGRSAPIRVSIERIVFEAPSGYALSFVEDDHGQRACRALTGEAPQ